MASAIDLTLDDDDSVELMGPPVINLADSQDEPAAPRGAPAAPRGQGESQPRRGAPAGALGVGRGADPAPRGPRDASTVKTLQGHREDTTRS